MLCICVFICPNMHLETLCIISSPSPSVNSQLLLHLSLPCFGSMSPCRQSFRDMHPCESGSPLLDPLRVAQLCKRVDLWAQCWGGELPRMPGLKAVLTGHLIILAEETPESFRELLPFWLCFIEFFWHILSSKSWCLFLSLLTKCHCFNEMKPLCKIQM